jgi:Mpv17 / PMP22 family
MLARRSMLKSPLTMAVRRSASTAQSVAAARAAPSKTHESVFRRLLSWYSAQLEARPLLTKAITSGIIAGSGDLLCQAAIERPQRIESNEIAEKDAWWDAVRTLRFGFLGGALVGPVIHYWFQLLNFKLVPGQGALVIAKRVALDQFVFTSMFLPLWMSSLWTLEDPSTLLTTTPGRLVETIPPILFMNWCVWIPAQSINFKFVPYQYQVLYSNLVGLAWNTYLSYSTRSVPQPVKEAVEQAAPGAVVPM